MGALGRKEGREGGGGGAHPTRVETDSLGGFGFFWAHMAAKHQERWEASERDDGTIAAAAEMPEGGSLWVSPCDGDAAPTRVFPEDEAALSAVMAKGLDGVEGYDGAAAAGAAAVGSHEEEESSISSEASELSDSGGESPLAAVERSFEAFAFPMLDLGKLGGRFGRRSSIGTQVQPDESQPPQRDGPSREAPSPPESGCEGLEEEEEEDDDDHDDVDGVLGRNFSLKKYDGLLGALGLAPGRSENADECSRSCGRREDCREPRGGVGGDGGRGIVSASRHQTFHPASVESRPGGEDRASACPAVDGSTAAAVGCLSLGALLRKLASWRQRARGGGKPRQAAALHGGKTDGCERGGDGGNGEHLQLMSTSVVTEVHRRSGDGPPVVVVRTSSTYGPVSVAEDDGIEPDRCCVHKRTATWVASTGNLGQNGIH